MLMHMLLLCVRVRIMSMGIVLQLMWVLQVLRGM